MPPGQASFAQAEYGRKEKRTRREIFLEKMEQVVRWARLMEVTEPHYPKSGKRGRPPIGLGWMLRMYFVQQWYRLADEVVKDAIYDSQALRNFMDIDLSRQSVPDATTPMGFRHLPEANDLAQATPVEINAMLIEQAAFDLFCASLVYRARCGFYATWQFFNALASNKKTASRTDGKVRFQSEPTVFEFATSGRVGAISSSYHRAIKLDF